MTRVLDMADQAELRDMIRERLKDDSEYRLLGLRLREARHVELRALRRLPGSRWKPPWPKECAAC